MSYKTGISLVTICVVAKRILVCAGLLVGAFLLWGLFAFLNSHEFNDAVNGAVAYAIWKLESPLMTLPFWVVLTGFAAVMLFVGSILIEMHHNKSSG